MANAKRDDNRVTTLIGVSSLDMATPANAAVDPVTGEVLVQASISGTVPLPTGAATSANQTDGSQKTQVTANALSSSPLVGQKAMTGSAVQLQTNTLINGVIITAKSTNTANVLLGGSGVTTTADGSGNGYILEPGASVSYAGNNTNTLYAIGTSADVISFLGS